MKTRSLKSTALLSGQLQFHIDVHKTDKGYKAVASGAEGYEGVGAEEHQAVNNLKEQLREAANSGTL